MLLPKLVCRRSRSAFSVLYLPNRVYIMQRSLVRGSETTRERFPCNGYAGRGDMVSDKRGSGNGSGERKKKTRKGNTPSSESRSLVLTAGTCFFVSWLARLVLCFAAGRLRRPLCSWNVQRLCAEVLVVVNAVPVILPGVVDSHIFERSVNRETVVPRMWPFICRSPFPCAHVCRWHCE